MRLGWLALPALLLLSACAGWPSPPSVRQELAPGIALTLPDRPPFGEDAQAVQLVLANYGGRRDRFQAAIEVSPARFVLAMTVPSGPRIMTVEWREGEIAAKRGIAPESLPARRLLADFMLVYAPEEALRGALSGGDFVDSGSGARRLFRNGVLLVEVTRPGGDPWEGPARLRNFAHDYELVIDSRRIGPQ